MKTHVMLTLFLWCTATVTYSQVGMTTNNPNPNAVLDLNKADGTNDKGLLLPKVDLISTDSPSPMSNHTAGMKVYNTRTNGTGATAVTPGVYYNNGISWVRLETNNAWSINGNSGTNPTINILGTKDAQDFVIKTNNVERMRIASTGQTLIGTPTVPAGSTAGLIIDNGTTKGAIQIKDGTQTDDAVLMSDADGVASWSKPVTDIYYSTVAQTFPKLQKTTLQTSSPMTIKESGTYFILLRWWGNTDGANTISSGSNSIYHVNASIEIYINGSSYYNPITPSSVGGAVYQGGPNSNSRITFNRSTVIPDLNKGDIITIVVYPNSVGVTPQSWYTGKAGTSNKLYMPSVVVAKL